MIKFGTVLDNITQKRFIYIARPLQHVNKTKIKFMKHKRMLSSDKTLNM